MALRGQRARGPPAPLEDPAALHDEGDVGQQLQVVEGVATDGDHVGQAARGQRPDPVLPAEQLGRDHRCRLDGGHRGHPVPGHVGQLAGVPAVRVDAAVGAVGDLHPCLDRPGEAVALGLGGGLVLGQGLGRPALPGPLVGDVVAVVDVGDQVGAALGQQPGRLVVQQRAVLDRAGAGPGGVDDPWVPWAWAATWVPWAAASSTAAASSAADSSGAPGRVPRASTAPVAITLMKSAPPYRIARTRRLTSSGPAASPNRRSRGSSMSGARPVTDPPPPGTVIRPPTAIRARHGAVADRVTQAPHDARSSDVAPR